MSEPTKQCVTCRRTKPHRDFRRHRLAADGLESICRLCRMGIDPDAQAKRCRSCRKVKPHSQFSKSRSRFDGLTPQCKRCKGLSESARYHARKSQSQHKEP